MRWRREDRRSSQLSMRWLAPAAAGLAALITSALALTTNLATALVPTSWIADHRWLLWILVAALSAATIVLGVVATRGNRVAHRLDGDVVASTAAVATVTKSARFGRKTIVDEAVSRGVVFEEIVTQPDGSKRQSRAFTEASARILIETRLRETVSERDRDDRG